MFDLPPITDDFVADLITCPKELSSAPKPRNKNNGYHIETGLPASSSDGRYRFAVFIRQHKELIENFTVGLTYLPDGGLPFTVIRYNGQHGRHKNSLTGEILDNCCHIHKVRAEVVSAGFKPDNHAVESSEYSSLDEAKLLFFKQLAFSNYLTYFPELAQASFPNIK